ncbi:Ankyrin repeat-containing protein [Glarea lozoyensis ATCC 20868]|uniref:Ankyrin repeat-containing protein n=1 Tax=Glarea lozoyensis (strain ATCC 20868 / MF5171) TaxID=1116229 RepID=S3D6X6_GLAL2|nr:Ankyrin repeat-containing protein [Glarea lozoyensis ATCC 20868]EPE34242.1 Ankyrin repeat-containing protein [Glarea lozoyensis ATCC 20868]
MSQNRSDQGFAILVASIPYAGLAQSKIETIDDNLARLHGLLNGIKLDERQRAAVSRLLRKSYDSKNPEERKRIISAVKAKDDQELNQTVGDEFYHDMYEAARTHDVEVLSRFLDCGAELHEGVVKSVIFASEDIEDVDSTIKVMELFFAHGLKLRDIPDILIEGVDINWPAVFVEEEAGPRQLQDGVKRLGNRGTALHWAVKGHLLGGRQNRLIDRVPRVRWLLEHDADPEIEDAVGKRAIDYARSQDNQEMVELLLSYRTKDDGGEK